MPGHQALGEGADEEMVGKSLDDIRERRAGPFGAVGPRRESEGGDDPEGRQPHASRQGHPGHGHDATAPGPTPLSIKVYHRSGNQRHHRPTAHERVERRGRPEPGPGNGRPAADEPADADKHQGPGEDLRFTATDHPLPSRRSVAGRQ